MQLFFNPDISDNTDFFSFDRQESKHITKVLRKKEGDYLYITNGLGWCFKAEIVVATPNKCQAKIVEKKHFDPSKYYLHLAVAPTKMNDRFEWFLEKAVEIGVQEITPLICERSERKEIKTARIERIVQAAMKQSLNYYLPKLNAPHSFKRFIDKNHLGKLFIAHCEKTERSLLKNQLKPEERVTILIGPEGDFSQEEIQLAKQKGFLPLTLGETRLRTETAAVVACHSVAFINL